MSEIPIPRISVFDATLSLIRDGYLFVANRSRALDTDIFTSRLLLKKTIFIHGADATAIFYDTNKFMRHGALPERVKNTLFGKAGVQTLDDLAHRQRKALFMSVASPQSTQKLKERFEFRWQEAIERWQIQRSVILFNEGREILFRAVCDWAGIPYGEDSVHDRARDLSLMVDAFGAVGLRHWKGRRARKRMEAWAALMIEKARDGNLLEPGGALHQVALYTDVDGALMPAEVAVVELLNVIRPTVAIAYYIAFTAHALLTNPQCRAKLLADDAYRSCFVQEVRRFYPFTPLLGAKVRESFQWQGFHFPKGMLTILDVYGTNHDSRLWPAPEQFMPERFQAQAINAFNFIPSGGGEAKSGHRCSGEGITCDAIDVAARMLAALDYKVPAQDLSIDLSRMPTLPKSGFIIEGVHKSRQL